MNIGSFKANAQGTLVGKIATMAVSMRIALRELYSTNPKAPRYEIYALSVAKEWVRVGALFEMVASTTGEIYLNGNIEDPSLDKPLYITCFRQDDGSHNIVWTRPTRRRDVDNAMTSKQTDDALPPLPGSGPATPPAEQPGLGDSTVSDEAFA